MPPTNREMQRRTFLACLRVGCSYLVGLLRVIHGVIRYGYLTRPRHLFQNPFLDSFFSLLLHRNPAW